MNKSFTFLLFIFLVTCSLSKAQTFLNEEADQQIKGAEFIQMDSKRNTVSFIRLNEKSSIAVSEHLQWLKTKALHLNSSDALIPYRVENDLTGFTHYRYKQSFNNIPVEYGVYYVHFKSGKVISANGEFYKNIKINTIPAINKTAAFNAALKFIKAKVFKSDTDLNLNTMKNKGELMVLPLNRKYYLVYKFDIYATAPLKRVYIYIDANTGAKVEEINRIETTNSNGTAITAYNGTVSITTDSINATNFRLNENSRGNGIYTHNLQNGTSYGSAVDFTDNDNIWNNTVNQDNYATDAHFGAEATYDFYLNSFGRNSYDNAGAAIHSYIHYSSGYVNAFWDGSEMTYGDGDGVDYLPLTSLDIVGHEITHAITENTAALVYANESGALNESFSDIFGVTIDFYKNPLTANFLEGDQINVNGIPFRNMGDPNQYNNPDTYGGTYWNNPNEVHNNSGVQNFWYYLLSQGGNGVNDIGNSYLVNGIGLNDAIAICYRNLSVYLTPNATYADARTYAIQSAVDLFGSCSAQTIQTTNAWYAVGVGGIFSNAVVAGFGTSQNYYCVIPATINFTNSSINATSYSWSFGDGGTSTLANPAYSYNTPGVYTVTLIASGAASCASTDTLTISNYINVTNGGGPLSPACTPSTTANCCGIGISNFQFNTINKSSGNASEGYKDFTCSNATTITAGNPAPINVTTGTSTSENVTAWIDYNNDGLFNNTNEKVFTSINKLLNHSGVVNTPVNAVLDTALRMRIIDDNQSNTITDACYNPQNGQAEDYTVTFVANTQPPIADFTANTFTINVGSSVQFTDLTINAPTAWQWNFAGGAIASSFVQNPNVVYNTVGNYAVTLHVSNSFGTDSITKTTYIHVVNSINICTGITTTSAANGQLFDSGGPTGYYQNGEACDFLIDPGCAISITLSFTQFSTESGFDYLAVFDGSDATGPSLFFGSGSTLPPNLIANSGKMYIRWSSDGSVISSGFAATWTSVIGSGIPPVAAFAASSNTPPLGTTVTFTDQTTNTPISWAWDFGDGGVSTFQNPNHKYITPGTYNATLISFNCISSDSVTQIITVQSAPTIIAVPDSFNINLNCTDSITLPIIIYNTGSGDLVYNTSGSSLNTDTIEILAFIYGSDLSTEYPNTINAINQYYPKNHITTIISTIPSDLQNALAGKSVLLFPEQESGASNVYNALASIVQDFVTSGGTAIICGSTGGYENRMYDLGLFTGSYIGYLSGGEPMDVLDTSNSITEGFPLNIPAANATAYHSISNPDAVKLVAYSNNDIVTYRPLGLGQVIYIGFDYYAYDNYDAKIIANSVSKAVLNNLGWIELLQTTDTISPGDSTIIYVTFNSTGYNGGIYTGQITLYSNDPSNPTLNIPCTMNVSGPAAIALSDSCLNFGTTMQFTSTSDTIKIYNNGCDSLHVTGMNSSSSEFTFSPAILNVAPGAFQNVVVTFAPTSIGIANTILSIYNNDIDTVICLNGIATGAPIISVDPDTFNVILNCNDSITLPLTIYNTGSGNLILNVEGSGNTFTGDTSVLVIQEGASWGITMSDFLQSNYGITPTVIASSQIPATDFSIYNVIITVSAQSDSYYSNISLNQAKFEAFVFNGGILEYQVATYSSAPNVNLAGGAVINYGNTENQNTGLMPLHPLLNGISNPLNGNYANHCYFSNIPANADVITETTLSGSPTTIQYNYGSGFIMATGMTWEYLYGNGGYNTTNMLPNAISYIFSKIQNSADWIIIPPTTDTIAAGDSIIVYVTFNSSGLSAGNYTGEITINSNDPLNPVTIIPCFLSVSGAAEIALSDSCIIFGSTTQFSTITDTVQIYNNGCDTLSITSMVSTSSQYTFSPSTINIAPGTSENIAVSFTPTGVGNIIASLNIYNNANDTVLCLNGIALEAPEISVVPDSFNVSLNACSDSITLPMYVKNTGGNMLYFNINGINVSSLPQWIQLSPYTDSLSNGDSILIYVTFYSAGLSGGTYNGNIIISSNDPLHPFDTIPCTLNIAFNPCADFNFSYTSSCSGIISFNDSSINTPTSWSWTFGDGGTSTLQNPMYQYLTPGTYSATLIATNINGSDSYSQSISVNPIAANISVTGNLIMNQPLSFNAIAPGSTSWSWNFGDGNFANIQSPLHTYTAAGTYIVSLTVTTPGCSLTIYDTLIIVPVGINEIGWQGSIIIHPNPFNDLSILSYELIKKEDVTIEVYDVAGKKILSIADDENQKPGKHNFEIKLKQQGVYFVRINIAGNQSIRRIVKTK